jgi:phage shock protein PspC (stress-responsive transcriptional regulator)
MEKLTSIKLTDHPNEFPLEEDAYQVLNQYFDGARARLRTDPDGDEVLRDLERSIGDRLDGVIQSGKARIGRADVEAAIKEVGYVDTGDGSDSTAVVPPSPPKARPLARIKEGQWLAGVCNGLAAYSGIRLDWLRTIALFLTVLTGGFLILVYAVMAIALPVVETRADYEALRSAPAGQA